MELYEVLLIIGQGVIGLIALLTRLNQNAFQLRLTEIEQRGADARRNDENTSSALALAATVAAMFEPITKRGEKTNELLDGMIALVEKHQQNTESLITGAAKESRLAHQIHLERIEAAAETMTTVTARRDDQHKEVIARLDKHQGQIERLITEIKTSAIPDSIRGDITLLISLATGISTDVKQLLPKLTTESGEAKAAAPDVEQETSSHD